MKSYNSGRLIAEKLKMSDHTGQHVVLCPFHHDSDKSFSLDLDKGVFFCHGGCAEPKGGGIVEFLVKWARLIDQKPITKDEARRQLNRGASLPNAAQLRQEMHEEELRLFARLMLHVFADALRQIERSMAYSRSLKILKIDYRLHDLIEWCFDVCLASNGAHLHPDLDAVYETAKAHGWWSYLEAQKIQRQSRRYVRRLRALNPPTRRITRTPIPKGPTCRATPSQMKMSPKRQPVLLRTPVPMISSTTTKTTLPKLPQRQPVQ